jgi:hypothetical protein
MVLPPVQNAKVREIFQVVADDILRDFDPRMGTQGRQMTTDDELGIDPMPTEQARDHDRAL